MSLQGLSNDEPLRVMALHSLNYCERLFYLEEVEGIQVTNSAMYAGRQLHDEREADDLSGRELRAFEVSSDKLGLYGKLDAVRRRDGAWVPYEHKRGRSAQNDQGKAVAWPSDFAQVVAYALLLEEQVGEPITEARIRYHKSGVTVRVAIDAEARSRALASRDRARELRGSINRPPVTTNERLCINCSLAPVCLPEEARLAVDEDWEVVRLFPPQREGRVLHVVSHGAKVSRTGNEIKVLLDGESRDYPIEEIDSIILHGYAQITTQAVHLCGSKGIPVHWFSGGGYYIGGTTAGPSQVQRRIRQYEGLRLPAFRVGLARRLASARIEGQLRYLLRATRGNSPRSDAVQAAIAELRDHLRRLSHEADPDVIRGHEGAATKSYLQCLPLFLKDNVAQTLHPHGRSRRPPRDRFNAILSFGYALLQRSVHQAVVGVGLEPSFGFYHTPRSAAPPLVLDIMDLFRVALWDIPLIGSLNRLQWSPDDDFVLAGDAVWLSDKGRRKAIELFERRLADTWRHPIVDYSLSYERTIELEVRLLEKEWSGEPGLFARSKLR